MFAPVLILPYAIMLLVDRGIEELMKNVILTAFKVLTCGVVFFIGTILGGQFASALGLPLPEMPKGTDPNILAGFLLLISLGIGALLSILAARIIGRWLSRWLILFLFGWIVYSFSTYIEAAIYTTFSSASLYKVVMDLVAFAASSALAATFFPAHPSADARPALTASPPSWAARLFLAWAAFPLIYLGFGKLVEPFVIDVYQQGLLEMTAPGWNQIIPAQMFRSLLFLVICLAIIRRWNRSRWDLRLTLAGALFLLVGGFYMLQAYWFPVGFRLAHTLEILADSLVYTACLVALFPSKQNRKEGQTQTLPAN